jgi:hypothetical protein
MCQLDCSSETDICRKALSLRGSGNVRPTTKYKCNCNYDNDDTPDV